MSLKMLIIRKIITFYNYNMMLKKYKKKMMKFKKKMKKKFKI